MRSLPTRYGGTVFRSRAEARWAIVFDMLELAWRYEPEGFALEDVCYLPDFYLPEIEAFAEVKGVAEAWDRPALRKAESLAVESRGAVLLLDEIDPASQVAWAFIGDEGKLRIGVAHSALKSRVWVYPSLHEAESDPIGLDLWSRAAWRATHWQFPRKAA